MLFLCDMSMLVHQFFHVRKVDDADDLAERIMTRMEKMRLHFTKLFPNCSFVAVFDNEDRSSYRKIVFPAYKNSRTKDSLLVDGEYATRLAVERDADWISVAAPAMFEADDVISTLSTHHKGKVIIHSIDSDMHSLLEDGRVTILKKANTPEAFADMELEWFTAKDLKNLNGKYGFEPTDWLTYQSIIGGKDDVPGWDDAGPVVAKRVIESGYLLNNLNLDCDRLNLNKRQKETYEQFRRDLPVIACCRHLKRDLGWPDTVPFVEKT
jgi:5'-3' exonuclease